MNLSAIKVLWRSPELGLWGIPHEMRPGQSPRDLWESRLVPDTVKQAQGWHGATMRIPGAREGWIWLGSPGWWGHLTKAEQAEIKAFLSPLRAEGRIPGNHNEWSGL